MMLGVTAAAQETITEEITSVYETIQTEDLTDPDEPEGESGEVTPVDPTNPEEPAQPETPDNPDNPDNPENPDNPDDPDIPDEPDVPEEPKLTFDELPGDYVVGRMYICTQIVFLGHSWIYIESTFDGEIPVGCYTMEPFGSVSVGTFLFSRRDGMGVYYNVERYSANEYGLKGQSWLGMDITKDDIVRVSKEIKDWNYWDPYFNCTFFAAKVWNSVSDKFIMPMMFPIFIKAQTQTKGGNKNILMQDVEAEECFKQKKTGNSAYLVTVKESSLSRLG